MTPQDLIRAAAKIIETQGWCSGTNNQGHAVHVRDQSGIALSLFRGDNTGQDKAKVNPGARSFSIYGALVKAMDEARGAVADPGSLWEVLHAMALAEGVRTGGQGYVHPVIGLNEAEGQTKDGVLAFLERCAVEFEGDAADRIAAAQEAPFDIGPEDFDRGTTFTSNVPEEDDLSDMFEVEIIPPGPYVDPRQRGADPYAYERTATHLPLTDPINPAPVKAPVPQIKAEPAVDAIKAKMPPISWGEES
jgi:hypothetical protein